MSHFILERFNQFPGHPELGLEGGTIGRVDMAGQFQGFSIEKPWRNNEPFESCVPDGEYRLEPFDSPQFGLCFIMVNPDLGVYAQKADRVLDSDRFLCLFVHVANWAKDVQGCVGLGTGLGFSRRGYMVTNSSGAIDTFRDSVDMDTEHTLSIFTRGPAI